MLPSQNRILPARGKFAKIMKFFSYRTRLIVLRQLWRRSTSLDDVVASSLSASWLEESAALPNLCKIVFLVEFSGLRHELTALTELASTVSTCTVFTMLMEALVIHWHIGANASAD